MNCKKKTSKKSLQYIGTILLYTLFLYDIMLEFITKRDKVLIISEKLIIKFNINY